MGMERLGLVGQLEAELERIISLGMVPQDGKLASERTLASQYGVSRATAREALVRLRTRGLVEVHPGRRARAVVMEQAVRLENLGTALLGEGPSRPERHAMLAAYLELRREVTVELLSACCEKASEEELERVRNACFLLGDAACWELKRPQWLALEFELLRQAALAAQRPGHLLLIQTLERACRGMAGRVEPYLDSPALYRWTQCALEALCSKDVETLRYRLPALLQTSDERVLQALAPSCEAYGLASFIGAERQVPEVEEQAHSTVAQGPEVSESAEALLTASQVMEVSTPTEAILTSPRVPVAGELTEAPFTSVHALEVDPSAPEPIPAGGPGALCAEWSGLHTTLHQVPPGGALPVSASAAPLPIPTTGRLWPGSTEEDSWPWSARGRAPELT
jgi:GntR family transcriptional repressor for pyruvate dehydrogenase complex